MHPEKPHHPHHPHPTCQVHREHRPPLWTTPGADPVVDKHHIHPTAMHGPDTADNWVWTCPTGHRKIHAALRAIIDGRKPVGTREELRLARLGFDRWVAAGRPGHGDLAGHA